MTVLVSLFLPAILWAQEIPLGEVVEKLQNKYRQTTTLSADFHQINYYKAVNQKQEAGGKVWIKKPGLMRWDYSRPEKNQVISDGKTLWMYTPADKQVIKSKIDEAFGGTPQDFLMGLGDLSRRFNISYADPPRNPQGFLMLNLTPSEKEPTLSKIMLEVDPRDFEVQRFSLLDLYGNLTTLIFANSKFNGELADSWFRFKIPPGVEVISPPRGSGP
jgi:outer membrane lipoprotein carrier protein